jgi:hypothetical protein
VLTDATMADTHALDVIINILRGTAGDPTPSRTSPLSCCRKGRTISQDDHQCYGAATAFCPAGDSVLGGGGEVTNFQPLSISEPFDRIGWKAGTGSSGQQVTVWAICAAVNPA